ncbi:hypothetical protein QYE76_028325 [Lolium multiflorum]|uniref:Uncharacterized protein n=1 Tax=Lolium multiflorum TaxID=4521 RepID=A0AAD8VEF8_LOLMU|nr:hypothetical protein QYE76_028325 [Lolium multiflorum]
MVIISEGCPTEYYIASLTVAKILRSLWNVEATEEEKIATEALMTRIHELRPAAKSCRDSITAYFRIRVQPLQARKNPLWMYAGDKDVDRVSKDLSHKDWKTCPKDLSLTRKTRFQPVSCGTIHVATKKNLPQCDCHEHVADFGFIGTHRAEETSPLSWICKANSCPSELPRQRGEVVSSKELNIAGTSVQPFISLGFIGYRNTVNGLKEALLTADKRADDLAIKLKKSEEAREKAEKDASSIEDLRKRLHEAETALSDKITQQIAREENVTSRLESLNRRFVRKMSQDFELQKPEDDRLLDALSLLEIHGDLVRRSIFDAQAAFSRLFPYFFPKKEQPSTFAALTKCFVPEEDLGLALRQENLKIGVEGTIALVAESQQNVDWAKLVFDNYTATPRPSDALPAASYSKKASVDDFTEDSSNANLSQELNDLRQQLQSIKKQSLMIMERVRKSPEREKVALQETKEALALRDTAVTEAAQAVSREEYMLDLLTDASLDMAGSFLDSAAEDERVETRSNLLVKHALENNSGFWSNPDRTRRIARFQDRAGQPKTLPELMNKFKDSRRIHDFVKAQLIAGAGFALIMLQICHSKLEMTKVVETVHTKLRRRRRGVDKIDERVTPVAKEMIDDLLRMDADFFVDDNYADFMGHLSKKTE